MKAKLVNYLLGIALTAINIVQAQSSPSPSPGTPSVLPRPDFHFPGNVGRTYQDSDPYMHSWVGAHVAKILGDYQESLKREPLIPVGAPLEFVPRSKQP
jgi:hypothetical protein